MFQSLRKRFSRLAWPEDRLILIIRVMGLAVSAVVVVTGWLFFVLEMPALWREGGATLLIVDGAIRLIGSVLFGALAYLPYALAIAAISATRHRLIFAGLAALIFVAHAALTIQALYFPTRSTSALGVIFLPIYLTIPVLAVRGVVWGINRDTKSRSSH
nr:hypothetical protein [Oxalobacteraceae bacterium]